MIKRILYLLFVVIVVACTPQKTPIEPVLIVEGWIENEGHPTVMLHYSIVMGEKYDSISELMMDKLVSLGKVTISDGYESVVLTGGLDTNYMPPYKYTSTHIIGQVGETYTIEVEYEDKIVTAQTTIPEPAFLDSIKVQQSENNDSVIHLFGYLTDSDVEKENYYVLFYRYRGDKQYMNCFLGLFSDEDVDDRGVICMPIYRNVALSTIGLEDIEGFNPSRFFKPWDKIDIKLTTVDSLGYRFWSEFSAMSTTSRIAFMPVYTNVYSNIEGGKGYWIGYGEKVYPLTLKRDTVIRYTK